MPRVLSVRSLSKAELSQVVVVFEDGAETYWTRQIVFERLAGAREHLPPGVEPELGPISTGLGEIFQYTLEGEGLTAMDLRTIQDWILAPQLRPIPGVNEVNSFGGEVKQYQVLVHPDRLVKYRLTVRDVVRGDRARRTGTRAAAWSSRGGSRRTCAAWASCATSRTSSGSSSARSTARPSTCATSPTS